MVSYSSEQFYRDWRFALETDFLDNGPSREAADIPYAHDGRQQWGDELKRIPFETAPSSAAINYDCSILAVAVDSTIILYNAKDLDFEEIGQLEGHISRVDSIAYRPQHPNTLVSAAQNNIGGSIPASPTIIIWDTNRLEQFQKISTAGPEIKHLASTTARTVAQSEFFVASPANHEQLALSFELPIRHSIARANAANNISLYGRLQTGFQSHVFSPSGHTLLYLPGSRPHSNGDDQWDIAIYSMTEHRNVLRLSGHRDAIMWHGYSSNQELIGSVSWDKTSRLWDAWTGELLHTFHSKGQNWTGGFAPSAPLFATTCGDGTVSVYSTVDGGEVFSFQEGASWKRALSWSSGNPNWLVVGGKGFGELVVLDVEKKNVVNFRKLSERRAKVDEEHRRFIGGFLEANNVRWVGPADRERLALLTTGDGSAEVYDLGTNGKKYRFARAGTDSYAEENEEEDASCKKEKKRGKRAVVTSKGGYRLEVWENGYKGRNTGLFVATVDGDAVRVWWLRH